MDGVDSMGSGEVLRAKMVARGLPVVAVRLNVVTPSATRLSTTHGVEVVWSLPPTVAQQRTANEVIYGVHPD